MNPDWDGIMKGRAREPNEAAVARLAAEHLGRAGTEIDALRARIAALEAALGEICENAYLTGTDPDWSPCAVKAEIIERARVVLGAPKP